MNHKKKSSHCLALLVIPKWVSRAEGWDDAQRGKKKHSITIRLIILRRQLSGLIGSTSKNRQNNDGYLQDKTAHSKSNFTFSLCLQSTVTGSPSSTWPSGGVCIELRSYCFASQEDWWLLVSATKRVSHRCSWHRRQATLRCWNCSHSTYCT